MSTRPVGVLAMCSPTCWPPSTRVAIEYDSPGPLHDAHGPLSVDHEKDSALRRVGVGGHPCARRQPRLIGPYDVAATGPTRAAAAAVIDQYHRVLLGGERSRTHLATSGDLRTSTQWEQLALDLDAQYLDALSSGSKLPPADD